MIALYYISRWILTVKAAGINPHWQSLEEVVLQAAQEVGVPQLLCYTSLGLLNISITFSNAHLLFNFAVPMVWREPRNHANDCYFCLSNITGFNASSRKKIKYPNIA